MERDRRPVAYATFAWIVAVGLLIAIVALHTSPPPDVLGEPTGEPQGAADKTDPEPRAPIQTSGPATGPPPGNVTVPQDTNYTFNGSVRSDPIGAGQRSHRLSTLAANGLVAVDIHYRDQAPANATAFPGQKTNVRYDLYRNGTLIGSAFISPAGWGNGTRLSGGVDGGPADWEIRLTYDWPSDFDYTFDVNVDYPD